MVSGTVSLEVVKGPADCSGILGMWEYSLARRIIFYHGYPVYSHLLSGAAERQNHWDDRAKYLIRNQLLPEKHRVSSRECK